jgi:hypothetical protein
MSKFTLLFFVLFLGIQVNSFAQTEIPKPDWQSRSDFKASEDLVKTFIRDIEKNPVNDLQKQEKADYVIRWVMACPYVAIKLKNGYFEKILNDNKYKFANYNAYGLVFGEVLYYLENPFDRDRSNAFRSGVYFAMDMYKKLKEHDNRTKCETLELFLKLEENNTLNTFIFLEN